MDIVLSRLYGVKFLLPVYAHSGKGDIQAFYSDYVAYRSISVYFVAASLYVGCRKNKNFPKQFGRRELYGFIIKI